MIIKKLELHGFKSFSERTRLVFHPGITAVIGPNGTGKSNIVDALLWVLRGRRLKALRGDRSGDVIFNGNAKKPPLSMGEVSLVLGDEKRTDGEDLVVSHRVFRSGENEYRLNGKLVRLRDIQDTLWKNAIGETEYFVIEQGSVGGFLTSKPAEKRLLLEEAAGTAFYKEKKRLTQNKLDNSEQNLIRLEDIIIEVEKSVNTLKRQAGAAVRYRKLRESIRELTLALFRERISEMEKSQEVISKRYRESLERENGLISRTRVEEKNLSDLRKEIWSFEKELKNRQEQLYALKSRHSRQEAELEREEKRIDFFTDKQKSAEAGRKELIEEHASIERERKQTGLSLDTCEKSLSAKKRLLEKAEQADEASRNTLEEKRRSLEEIRGGYLRKLSEQTEIKNETTRQETEIELIVRQTEKTGEEIEVERKRRDEIDKRLERARTEQTEVENQREALSGSLDNDRSAREKNAEDLKRLLDRRAELENRRNESRHHLNALEKMLDRERPAQGGDGLPGVLGLFADRIDSSPDHAPLIDVFYKDETRSTLIHARDLLSAASERRLKGHFLLLHAGSGRKPPSGLISDTRALGFLKSHLRPDDKVGNNLAPLNDAVIVKDLRSAVELWMKYSEYNFVTLQGDVLMASGLLKPGQKKEGLFTLKQEVRTLKKDLAETEKKLSPVATEIEQRTERQEKLKLQIRSRAEQLAGLDKMHADLERELAFGSSEKERIQARIRQLEQELENLSRDKLSTAERLAAQSSRFQKLEADQARLQQAVASQERDIDRMRREGEGERRRLFELRSEINVFKEKISGLQRQRDQFDKREQALAHRLKSLEHDIHGAQVEKSGVEARIGELKQQILSQSKEIEAGQNDLTRDESRMTVQQSRQDKIEALLNRVREEMEAAKDERVKWEIRKAERERDLVNLEESSWQELKKTLAEVKQEVEPCDFEIEETERRLEEARDQLSRFKAVNLMAEEEYQGQKERFDFLMKEKNDLVDSIASTREAIRKIDQESRQQFLKALTAVNRNFQEIFAILFKGGTAQVKLSDENQPLESGIDIIAQPPGKKVQSITLLSGGEKSLTSLAFFFALFRYKPAPFCILDEVDAALDEANLTRFLTLMKAIKHQTQFIIVTHNFKSMEVADYIYGTTMAEPNITSVYSVRMEEGGLKKLAAEPGAPGFRG